MLPVSSKLSSRVTSVLGYVLRWQDEHERQVRLALKKKKLQEQDEYESINVDDGQEGPYGGPAR